MEGAFKKIHVNFSSSILSVRKTGVTENNHKINSLALSWPCLRLNHAMHAITSTEVFCVTAAVSYAFHANHGCFSSACVLLCINFSYIGNGWTQYCTEGCSIPRYPSYRLISFHYPSYIAEEIIFGFVERLLRTKYLVRKIYQLNNNEVYRQVPISVLTSSGEWSRSSTFGRK